MRSYFSRLFFLIGLIASSWASAMEHVGTQWPNPFPINFSLYGQQTAYRLFEASGQWYVEYVWTDFASSYRGLVAVQVSSDGMQILGGSYGLAMAHQPAPESPSEWLPLVTDRLGVPEVPGTHIQEYLTPYVQYLKDGLLIHSASAFTEWLAQTPPVVLSPWATNSYKALSVPRSPEEADLFSGIFDYDDGRFYMFDFIDWEGLTSGSGTDDSPFLWNGRFRGPVAVPEVYQVDAIPPAPTLTSGPLPDPLVYYGQIVADEGNEARKEWLRGNYLPQASYEDHFTMQYFSTEHEQIEHQYIVRGWYFDSMMNPAGDVHFESVFAENRPFGDLLESLQVHSNEWIAERAFVDVPAPPFHRLVNGRSMQDPIEGDYYDRFSGPVTHGFGFDLTLHRVLTEDNWLLTYNPGFHSVEDIVGYPVAYEILDAVSWVVYVNDRGDWSCVDYEELVSPYSYYPVSNYFEYAVNSNDGSLYKANAYSISAFPAADYGAFFGFEGEWVAQYQKGNALGGDSWIFRSYQIYLVELGLDAGLGSSLAFLQGYQPPFLPLPRDPSKGSDPCKIPDCDTVHQLATGSFIDVHLGTHYHQASDGVLAQGAAGCAPCGAVAGAGMGALPAFQLDRWHRYADRDLPSSFGPGVFAAWDMHLDLGTSDDPRIQAFRPDWRFRPLMTQQAGSLVYRDHEHSTTKEARLYGADGEQTALWNSATRIELEYHDGAIDVFQVIAMADRPMHRMARLIERRDRLGNGIAIAYVIPEITAPDGGTDFRAFEIATITDAYGLVTTPVYGDLIAAGRRVVTGVTLPNGSSIGYRYVDGGIADFTAMRGLVGVDYPDGTTSSFTAEPDGDLWRVVFDDAASDAEHRRKTVWYSLPVGNSPGFEIRRLENGAGERVFALERTVAADGSLTAHVWDRGQLFRYQTDGAGNARRRDYATNWVDGLPLDQVTWEPDATYGTDTQHRVTATTDANGRTVQRDRDSVTGEVTRTAYPDGTESTTTHNAFAQPLVEVDRLGRRTEHTYDAQGNRLTRRDAAGTPAEALWQWTYNALGQMLTQTDPNGQVTEYDYYPAGHAAQHRLHTITHPADDATAPVGSEVARRAVEAYLWDAAGRLQQTIDAEGRSIIFHYDSRNRLIRRTYGDGSFESIAYGSGADTNLVVAETDRNGNQTQYVYDAAGRRITTIRAAGTPEAVTEGCTYLPGTTREASCTSAGNRRETAYDHRLRPIASTVYPRNDRSLITASVYDASDRLLLRIDAFGRATVFVHDVNDRVIRTLSEAIPGALDEVDAATVTRPTGANPPFVIDENVFDAEGQVIARIDARGIRSTYQYDTQGRLIGQVEADARLLADGSWELLPEAARTEMQYDPAGNVIAIRHPRSFVRDGSGAWINGPDGDFRTVRTYTARHRLTTETAAAGLDAASQPRPEQATRTWAYTLTGQVRSETDERGFTTTRDYTACCNRLHTVTDPTGVIVATYAYDSHGNVLAVTDGNGLTTTQTYDARHRVRTRTNAAGETTTFTYDDDLTDGLGLDADPLLAAGLGFGPSATGSAIAVANPLGETSRQVQDGLGRMVRSVTPLGHATTTAHDLVVGDLVETTVTNPLGHTVRSRRDGLGRERQRIDALGIVALSIGSDASGNALTIRDAAGVGQDCVFDGRGRDIVCTDTHGFTTTRSFDAHGNVVQATDADGQSTVVVFDARDRQTTVTDRLGGVTTSAYDASGNLLQLTDAEGSVTAYTYDARGLLVTELFPKGRASGARANGTENPTLPNTNQRSYTYDAGRRLATRLDQVEVVTTYAYDAANRLIVRAYPDAKDDTFAYDAASRLRVAVSGRSRTTVERVYDASGRLSEEWLLGQGPALAGVWKVAYGYDATDQLTTLTYPDGREVSRTYSPRQELATVTWAGQPIATRTYDAAGRLTTTTLGNGRTETRSYTPNAHLIATIQVPGVTDFSYSYDGQSRKTAETDAVRPEWSQLFGYDRENRLTTWIRGDGVVPAQAQDWDLSLVGDWQQMTKDGVAESRLHTPVHEVVRVGSAPLGYDKKGNLTRDEQDRRYAWDHENRLRRSRVFGTGSPTGYDLITLYHYDALGRRVAKVANGWVTRFLHAGAQVIQEEDGVAVEPAPVRTRDGDADVAAEDPATDLILDEATLGSPVTRISFQPETMANPPGFWSDKGRLFGERTNGLTYGWEVPLDSSETRRRLAHPLPEFDTFARIRPNADRHHRWSIALPDGSYPVIVVAGDAISTKHTNHLLVNGTQVLTDLTPWTDSPSYEQGNFDGWALQVLVVGGQLTIEAAPGARNPTLCWIAIGPQGALLPLDAHARLDALIDRVNAETWEKQLPTVQRRQYVYGSYVDEPLAFTRSHADDIDVTYLHANHLYSVAAATDDLGAVVERYRYEAYGRRTVTDASGVVERESSAIEQSRGFTGLYEDQETGLLRSQTRPYHTTLGRWMGRDPLGYVDGMGLYQGYFVPNALDPSGRALHAFDGTWNHHSKDKGGGTNVYKLYDLYQGRRHYFGGIGNRSDYFGIVNRAWRGFTGAGGSSIENRAFARLHTDYENGERVIDVIGFSRGASSALNFVNRLRKRIDGGCYPNLSIRFVGLFDAVGSYGWPGNDINIGKDFRMRPGSSRPGWVAHAIALNETREMFPVIDVAGADIQQGFRGGHSDIGGGWSRTGLSDITLMWMVDQGIQAGAPFRRPQGLRPDPEMLPHRIVKPWLAHAPRQFPQGLVISGGLEPEEMYRRPRQYDTGPKGGPTGRNNIPGDIWDFVSPDYTKE